jgi:hypothetical protein
MREGPKSVRLPNPSRTVSGSSPALTTKVHTTLPIDQRPRVCLLRCCSLEKGIVYVQDKGCKSAFLPTFTTQRTSHPQLLVNFGTHTADDGLSKIQFRVAGSRMPKS